MQNSRRAVIIAIGLAAHDALQAEIFQQAAKHLSCLNVSYRRVGGVLREYQPAAELEYKPNSLYWRIHNKSDQIAATFSCEICSIRDGISLPILICLAASDSKGKLNESKILAAVGLARQCKVPLRPDVIFCRRYDRGPGTRS